MKKVLGISAFYHDSAAALTVGGKIIAAVQEERFTRIKHTSAFPLNGIKYCLEEAGLRIEELDAIIFYDKPLLKFERLLQTYYTFSPKGLRSFLKAIPIWIKEKIFLKKMIYDGLKEIDNYDRKKIKFLFANHHLSHAASAFFPSPYQKAAILTIDGVGEWCTASISIGEGKSIRVLKEMEFPHSIGLLYSSFTYYLGFKVNSGEYKIMGLAPYGNPKAKQTHEYIEKIKTKLIDIKYDGSVWLDQNYFNYATGLCMVNEKKWEKLFCFKRRVSETELEQMHFNLALAIQTITEEIMLKMALEARRITGSDYLCLAGGVALNCVSNSKLLNSNIFKDIYVQPAAGDSGGALGAAMAVNHMYFDEPRIYNSGNDIMKGSYLGPDFSDKEILSMNKKVKAEFKYYSDFSKITEFTAKKISEGKIFGWFQGRMEFGPRALGNRSILADARNLEMQKRLNLKIKNRESFRPFAPSVMIECVSDYFDFDSSSPYMAFTTNVKKKRRKQPPDNHFDLTISERLYLTRSDIQAVTHVDFSSRLQTVHKETNQRYWDLINEFKNQTGYGLIVNTSFNVRGEPIVCTPYDAYRCFMGTDMDYLVIGNFIYYKKTQPDWQCKEKWKVKFRLD